MLRIDKLSSKHHGFVLAYAMVLLCVMVGIASLAVDYGRAQLVKAELHDAADAAARAAARRLPEGTTTARDEAVSAAAANSANGTSVVLNPTTDVEFGSW